MRHVTQMQFDLYYLQVLRERMMTDIRMEPLHEASVWTGDQLQDDHSWEYP